MPVYRELIDVVFIRIAVHFVLLKCFQTVICCHRDAICMAVYIDLTVFIDDNILNPEAENCGAGFI